MSLATIYAQTPRRNPVAALIIAHFDAHGVSFAAARKRILWSKLGEPPVAYAKFPVTGPQGLSSGQIKNIIDELNIAPQRIEIIDIPIDVRNPDASIKTLADLASIAPVYYYDHHETDVPFISRLHQHGIFATVFGDNVAMAAALELLGDEEARKLAIVGMVADRDRSVLKLVPREEVERIYLPLANKLDVIVRNPRIANMTDLNAVINVLSDEGVEWLRSVNVQYPPEQLARELERRILEEGVIAVMVDWSDAPQNVSMWVPKTLEQLLLIRGKSIAVAIVPAYNPRTRQQEGYDVRVLKYWLAPEDVPTPEEVAKDLIAQKALQGRVVGHADYISIRFGTIEEARRAAERIYRTIEGMHSTTAHLVNDRYVAEAVRRDFQAILQKLTEILEVQKKMYEEYLALKRKQVELLERTQRHEYD